MHLVAVNVVLFLSNKICKLKQMPFLLNFTRYLKEIFQGVLTSKTPLPQVTALTEFQNDNEEDIKHSSKT